MKNLPPIKDEGLGQLCELVSFCDKVEAAISRCPTKMRYIDALRSVEKVDFDWNKEMTQRMFQLLLRKNKDQKFPSVQEYMSAQQPLKPQNNIPNRPANGGG